MSKITIEDVLKKKKLIEQEQKTYHSSYFNADIDIISINPEQIIDIMQEKTDQISQYCKLIYLSCPFFAQKELQEQLNVADPFDTVRAVYDDNICEIFEIGNLIMARYGFTTDKVEAVKKP